MKTRNFSHKIKSALLVTALSALAPVASAATYDLWIASGGMSYTTMSGTTGESWAGRVVNVDVSDTFVSVFVDQGWEAPLQGLYKVLSMSWMGGGATLYSLDGINFRKTYNGPDGMYSDATAVLTGQTKITYSANSSYYFTWYNAGFTAVNVPGVPVPGAAWLFGSALAGLVANRARKLRRG